MDNLLYLAPAAGILSLIFAGLFAYLVLKQPTGTEEMQKIASAIQEGAMAYLNRQYRTVAIVAIILAAAIYLLLDNGSKIAFGFLAGAAASATVLVAVHNGTNLTSCSSRPSNAPWQI